MIDTTFFWFDLTFPNDQAVPKTESFREFIKRLSLKIKRLWKRLVRKQGLVINSGLLTFHKDLQSIIFIISSGQTSLFPILIVQLKDIQVRIRTRIAIPGIRIVIEQDTIILGRHHERHRYLGIILIQLLILRFIIKFIRLVLPQSIERLVFR